MNGTLSPLTIKFIIRENKRSLFLFLGKYFYILLKKRQSIMNSRSLTLMASHISLIFYEFQVSPFFFPVLKSPLKLKHFWLFRKPMLWKYSDRISVNFQVPKLLVSRLRGVSYFANLVFLNNFILCKNRLYFSYLIFIISEGRLRK